MNQNNMERTLSNDIKHQLKLWLCKTPLDAWCLYYFFCCTQNYYCYLIMYNVAQYIVVATSMADVGSRWKVDPLSLRCPLAMSTRFLLDFKWHWVTTKMAFYQCGRIKVLWVRCYEVILKRCPSLSYVTEIPHLSQEFSFRFNVCR